MRIGLVDVDGHNYPNYALMKISAWHKQRGDSVEWATPMFGLQMGIKLHLWKLRQPTQIFLQTKKSG